MDRHHDNRRRLPAAATAALALGATLLACAPTARSAEPLRLDPVNYMRLATLRRQLQLDSRPMAAMGWDAARAEAVLGVVGDWFGSNKDRLHEANVARNRAAFVLGNVRRQATTTRPVATRPSERQLRAAEKDHAAADARCRAIRQPLVAAVEAKLTPKQRRAWRIVRSGAEAGARRDWAHAPGLTAEQAKSLTRAGRARSRAFYKARYAATSTDEVEAEFRRQVEAILSKAQIAAVESARAARTENYGAVVAAERKLLPAPPRRRARPPERTTPTGPVRHGLAARYPRDQGIAKDPAAVFSCGFEANDWHKHWGRTAPPKNTQAVTAQAKLKFRPFDGKAMMVTVHKGSNYGTSLSYSFLKMLGAEPEEIYFRYYLRLADDWRPARGGKLPGIGGTYGRGGWGGRRSNGVNGWSARGLFTGRRGGRTPIGYYCYNADQRTIYGDHWVWEKDGLGFIENNRWYCIEQYARMNTPGRNDGILRAWVDGRAAFEKTDIRMRDVEALKIQSIWINVYFGGTWSARYTNHLFIDNVVIARKYIGPMARKR